MPKPIYSKDPGRLRLFRWLSVCLAGAMVVLAAGPSLAQSPPVVREGMIDLRQWDFARSGPVRLDGQWEFYWQRFVASEAVASVDPMPDFIQVPYVWNGHRVGAERIGGFGYATYRLRLALGADPVPLALHIIDFATAFTVYANGRPVYRAGTPGTGRDLSEPCFKPAVVVLPPLGPDVDLTVHVSNFHHRQGGLWDRITIGLPPQMHALREQRIAFNMVLLGGLLLMGFYHLGLYKRRTTDRTPLFFGLGCLAMLLRTLTTGERYLVQLFEGFPFELLSKLEYWGFYLAVGCFALFFDALFPRESNRRVMQGMAVVSALFSGLVLVAPLRIYSYSTPVFEVITLAGIGYGTLILGRAWVRKRPGANLFLIGFAVFAATAVNDILYSRQVIHTFYIGQFGFLAFIVAQAVLMSNRFSSLLSLVEIQKAKLIISEEKYRLLVENASDAIFIVQDGAFKFVNPHTETLFGFSAAELHRLPFATCIHPEDRTIVENQLGQTKTDGRRKVVETFRLIVRDGQSLWVQLNAVPFFWEGRAAWLNFLSDISDLKKTESRLKRIEKMQAIGTMAAGIARDIRLIGASLAGHTQDVLVALPSASQGRPAIQKVMETGLRFQKLAEKLLTFTLNGYVKLSPCRVGDILREAVDALHGKVGPGIEIKADFVTPGPLVMADPASIREVLQNLFTNAVEAMADNGGTLYTSVQEVVLPPSPVRSEEGLPPATYARLTVADSGTGIAREIQGRIFDPYFTTKAYGEGVGTGLAAVMGIVLGHGGDIEMVSTPGLGSTFHVYLPAMGDDGSSISTPIPDAPGR